jgi:hypothetical protein
MDVIGDSAIINKEEGSGGISLTSGSLLSERERTSREGRGERRQLSLQGRVVKAREILRAEGSPQPKSRARVRRYLINEETKGDRAEQR